MNEMGFTIEYFDEDTVKATLDLREEETRNKHKETETP